ncbi:MAG: hypothetical protein KatS3mg015_2749 [Fimbriimonadales bacterium]|nr:MAG: hypothetical protein KatS3mg015_2749 [Fimbriimonadales bacterium]
MNITTVVSNLKRALEAAPEVANAAISVYFEKEYDLQTGDPDWSAYILVFPSDFTHLCELLHLVPDYKTKPAYAKLSARLVQGVHIFPPPPRTTESSDEQV